MQSMQTRFSTATILLASGMMLLGNAQGQQASPATARQSTSTKTPSASGTKTRRSATSQSHSALILKTQKDKTSYAIGMNIGASLHRQSVDIDPSILERGIKDALAGNKALLTDDEVRAALTELQVQVRQQEQQKLLAEGQANKKEGDAFLAANKTKEGVVTLPSGLQYKILQKGTGVKPTPSDNVVINYRGKLIDGKEFDSSYKRGQPATFPVGKVIRGLSEAIQLMPVGSKWQLFVPAELAYGDRGAGAEIGPNSTLVFDVDLLSIEAQNQPPAQPANPFGNNKPAAGPQTPEGQNQQKTPPSNAKPATTP